MTPVEPECVPEQPRGPIAVDLFCLDCGYNLRGLSGETIRCPECGAVNSADVLEFPSAQIRTYLRKLEGALSNCIIVLLVAVPLALYCMARPGIWNISALALLTLIWRLLINRFRHLCNGRSGWMHGIFRYQLMGLIACVTVISVVVSIIQLADWLIADDWQNYRRWGGVAVVPIIVVVVLPIARVMRNWAASSVEVLRREVAMSLAREYFERNGP